MKHDELFLNRRKSIYIIAPKKELTQHSEFIPYDILLKKLLKKFTFIVIPKPISVVICKKVFLAIALIVKKGYLCLCHMNHQYYLIVVLILLKRLFR